MTCILTHNIILYIDNKRLSQKKTTMSDAILIINFVCSYIITYFSMVIVMP